MTRKVRMNFITNMCTHYVAKLFELLSQECDVDFYFTGGDEPYWNKENKLGTSNIHGKYLKQIILLPKVKFIPGLFSVFSKKPDIFLKTIDGRFILPFVFLGAKLLRKPFVLWTGLWSHPKTLVHKITFPFARFIYHHSDAIVAYGEHVKKYLIGLGIQSEKIFCAPHSVDNDILNSNVSEDQLGQLKKDLNLSDEKVILYVGRLEECKGLDFLIDGLARMENLDAAVLFIGNGSQEEVLKKRCRDFSLEAQFLGHIDNEKLYQYYALADIFVLPSITTREFKEPWGLVVNEAMNQGCPVVTTDAVGAAAGGLVEDGQTGHVVPEKNSDALSAAIAKLLKDDELRLRMGQNAIKKIVEWTPQQTMKGFMRAISFASADR